MVSIAFAFKLDAEVINDEDKKYRPPLVLPQAGHDEALIVPVHAKAFNEGVMAIPACLRL